jgi:hypothetical protein
MKRKLIECLNEDLGLHAEKVKRFLEDRRFLERLCADLLERFDGRRTILEALIENSKKQAKPRSGGYKLLRKNGDMTKAPALEENRLERAIWVRWRPHKANENVPKFLHVAPKVLMYQVPLFAKRDREGWGAIDLLGIGRDQLPVIIELKAERSAESPLGMLLQAARYAIALRKFWNTSAEDSSSCFRDDWWKALENAGCESSRGRDQKLGLCRIVCLTEDKYWEGKSFSSDFSHLKPIVETLHADHSISTTFANLHFSADVIDVGTEMGRSSALSESK